MEIDTSVLKHSCAKRMIRFCDHTIIIIITQLLKQGCRVVKLHVMDVKRIQESATLSSMSFVQFASFQDNLFKELLQIFNLFISPWLITHQHHKKQHHLLLNLVANFIYWTNCIFTFFIMHFIFSITCLNTSLSACIVNHICLHDHTFYA